VHVWQKKYEAALLQGKVLAAPFSPLSMQKGDSLGLVGHGRRLQLSMLKEKLVM
jgi:hypothetical protein